jgi:DNA-binding transcriptional regulator GbsR (MarR family)
MDLTADGTEETEIANMTSQEKMEGFLDVQGQQKKNMKQLTVALTQFEDMKKLDNKISDIWESPEFIKLLTGRLVLILVCSFSGK